MSEIPEDAPFVVEIEGVKFAVPEAVAYLLKSVSEERDELKEEKEDLTRYVKTLPDKLKWIADNASHHSSHWLHTQLYGMAKELGYGYVNMGTKDFYKVDALLKAKETNDG